MGIFTADDRQFQVFIEDTQGLQERLRPAAPGEDMAALERLVAHFRMKVNDFYREDRKLNIGVVGQVKAGKSSFLNTLLFQGHEILPKASTPKTATLTRMEYAEENVMDIEYYAVEDWEVLQDNAQVGLEDEIYTSAREIMELVRRNGLDPLPLLEKGRDVLSFDTYDHLIASLNQYVGEDGTYTPMVKSVTLRLNKEEFQGLSIVDTPGLNDPILSRTLRTKEFMELCDVVFFLSQSGSFLDKSDWILLSSQLPQKGVKRLVLAASKYDSGVRDVLKEQDEDDIFGDDGNTAHTIPDACRLIRRKLNKRAKAKVEEFVSDLTMRGNSDPRLIEVIRQCAEPVPVSAMAHNMAGKPLEAYTKEEQNVYGALRRFSKDMQKDLRLLGNFEEISSIFADVVAAKEAILAQKAKSFIPTEQQNLKGHLEEFQKKAQTRLSVLEKNDKAQLLEQKNFIEGQINRIRADIAGVFGELNARLETEKAAGVQEIRAASKEYLTVDERTGQKTRREAYRVSDSKWWNPFSWGKSHTEYHTFTEHYSYALASDAIDNIRKFSADAVNQVEQVFTDALELKEIRRKLLNVVIQNFDMGSETYDSTLFRILVEETVGQITFPVFHMDISDSMNAIAAKFTGELTSAAQRTELSAALSAAIGRIYEELSSRLSTAVVEWKEEMNRIAKTVEQSLLENINREFETLLAQYENKEQEINGYREYLALLAQESGKL